MNKSGHAKMSKKRKKSEENEEQRRDPKRFRPQYADIYAHRDDPETPGSTRSVHPSLIYLDAQLRSSNRKKFSNDEIAVLKAAQFISDAGLHREHGEKLLKLLRDEKIDYSGLPKTIRTLEIRATKLLSRCERFPDLPGAQMQEAEFDISSVNELRPKVHFQYKEMLPAALELLLKHQENSGLRFDHEERMCPRRKCRYLRINSCHCYF